ncbi:single stranded DNA-binding domain-containing protein [Pyxidicoccus xibeiensis]|uniref:DNA-binding protein n=1 Tax=Pyxidicoccus xibeiensis TaxID=2906759 RepID=UPI0020A820CF|nr:DNA-binding protein [Pyxidicoccus xibeiensis]MCP3141929.1 DNA-binding protein [Pyxidicoccus xibeiensis]
MFTVRTQWKVGLAALLAVTLVAAPGAVVAKAPLNSIAEARQQPLGSTVTVVGVATSFTGAFFPNDNGFAIQDGKVGIYILDSLDADIQVGQVVQVTGTLTNSFGQVLSVDPTSIEVLGEANVPPPHPVKTGEVSEETEGRLVRIKGTIVSEIEDDAPFGFKFAVDDGTGPTFVFVNTGTGIDVSELEQGQRVVIQGFSGEFLGEYEVDPVFQEDIRILPSP